MVWLRAQGTLPDQPLLPATLVNIEDTGVDNLGVVIDLGHSLFAKENPAEALHLLHSHGRLVDIELDDNYREWDDDLTAGALHLVETLEFLHVVRGIGWTDPLKLEMFPIGRTGSPPYAKASRPCAGSRSAQARSTPRSWPMRSIATTLWLCSPSCARRSSDSASLPADTAAGS
jgi:hypothetical protein